MVGGAVGATLVEILGPFGPAAFALFGGGLGAGLAARKEIKFEIQKIKCILLLKFKEWQEKEKKKTN